MYSAVEQAIWTRQHEGWYYHRRLHQYAGGDLTPVETENAYYDQAATPAAS